MKKSNNGFFRNRLFFSLIIAFLLLNLFIVESQVGITIYETNFVFKEKEKEKISNIKVYGYHDSLVNLSFRFANINEIIEKFPHVLQNYSEDFYSIKVEFYKNPIILKSIDNTEKILAETSFFRVEGKEKMEPGYRVIYIKAEEIRKQKEAKDYGISIIPSVEIPILVLIEGKAERKIEVIDSEVTYEKNFPILNVLIKNTGTVTSSFIGYVTISNFSKQFQDKLKPGETKNFKFPLNIPTGNYNVSVRIDYFSSTSNFVKEINIKEKYMEEERVSTVNIFPYLILILFSIISIIIIKKKFL